VGVMEGVGEGCVAVGVEVSVAVGVLVENNPAKGFLSPPITVTMMKIPSMTRTPANPPRK